MAPDVRATSDITSIVGNYYDRLMLERLTKNAVLYKLADKRSIPKGIGKSISFNRFTNFPTTTTRITEGVVPTQTYLSGTAVTATLYQLGAWTPVSDLLQVGSFANVVKECVENFGDAAATSVDTSLMYDLMSEDTGDGGEGPQSDDIHLSTWWNAKQGGLSCLYISGDGTTLSNAELISFLSADATASAGHVMDLDKVTFAVNKLRGANVRPYEDGYYKMAMHPSAMMEIQRTDEWQEYNKYTRPDVLDRGEVGRANGVRFYETTIMYQTNTAPLSSSATDISLSFSLIWGKGAFAVSELDTMRGVKTYVKGMNKYDTSNPINQWSTIGWKITMVGKVLNANCGYFVGTIVS